MRKRSLRSRCPTYILFYLHENCVDKIQSQHRRCYMKYEVCVLQYIGSYLLLNVNHKVIFVIIVWI